MCPVDLTPADRTFRARVERLGPLPFSSLVSCALDDPDGGFFTTGGMAGRRGDFLTAPEVGPLFGAVLAAALDVWWRELGEPDPFVVVEGGAGRGALAISVLAAAPRCASALTYVLVERSPALRAAQGEHLPLVEPTVAFGAGGRARGASDGPRVVSLAEMPLQRLVGVILANELLDNLPFDVVERTDTGWAEVRVTVDADGGLAEALVPADPHRAATLDELVPSGVPGVRVPWQAEAARWVRDARSLLDRGRLVVFDYGDDTAVLAERGQGAWLRTFRGHERGTSPFDALGTQDITSDVAFDQVVAGDGAEPVVTQADFLRRHGIERLVDEGLRTWHERAHLGDLEAIRGRSRTREGEALCDPAGMGSFGVLEWIVG